MRRRTAKVCVPFFPAHVKMRRGFFGGGAAETDGLSGLDLVGLLAGIGLTTAWERVAEVRCGLLRHELNKPSWLFIGIFISAEKGGPA